MKKNPLSRALALLSFLSLLSGCREPESPPGLYAVIDLRSDDIRHLPAVPPDLLTNAAYRTTKMVFRRVSAGTFTMGMPKAESRRQLLDETPHQVTISSDFYIGVFEVTRAQWRTVMGDAPPLFARDVPPPPLADTLVDVIPAVNVNWNDCRKLMDKLNSESEWGVFRFPTEAEWEYACRAGTTGAYAGARDEMGWYAENSGDSIKPVGLKKPNAWGLYDMHGNVLEWCSDWYGYYAREKGVDPVGPIEGLERIERGGSWCNSANLARSADRNRHTPATGSDHLGLRLVLTGPAEDRLK